jgi:hypothetical protein
MLLCGIYHTPNCDDKKYDNWLARMRNAARVSLCVAAALVTSVGCLNFLDKGNLYSVN